jgi:glycosyltransferase involved in cell wall biosynthesis
MGFSPQISIVMPCYQQVAYLEEAVRSVLDQEGVVVELLVMDPGSTDGSRELLQGLKGEYGARLRLHFEPDNGQSDAINRGMKLARGRVLAWLNSDDRYHPGALREVVSWLDADEPRWLYGRCGIIDGKNRPIFGPIVRYKNWRGRRFSLYKLLTEPFIPQMAAFWNRAIWERVGGVDVNRHMDMDYDLHLYFARIAAPKVLDSYLADSRVHPEAKSSTRTFEGIDAVLMTARQHAADLGWRGRAAVLMHRLNGMRTKVIYRMIKGSPSVPPILKGGSGPPLVPPIK